MMNFDEMLSPPRGNMVSCVLRQIYIEPLSLALRAAVRLAWTTEWLSTLFALL